MELLHCFCQYRQHCRYVPMEGLHLNWVLSGPLVGNEKWGLLGESVVLDTHLGWDMLKIWLLTLTRSLLAIIIYYVIIYYCHYHLLCHYLLLPLSYIMPYPDVPHVSWTVAPTATLTRAAAPLVNLAGLYLQAWLESHSKCRRHPQGLSIYLSGSQRQETYTGEAVNSGNWDSLTPCQLP